MTHEKHCSTQLSSNIPLPCDCSKRTIVSLDDVVFSPVEQYPTPTAERDKRIAELEQRHVQFMVTGGPVVMATEYERVNAQLAERDAELQKMCDVADFMPDELAELLASTSAAAERAERRIGARYFRRLQADKFLQDHAYDLVRTRIRILADSLERDDSGGGNG